jgi:hypothetical protein
MFLAGSTDRWSWSEDAFPPLAFCVHALVHDGLQVPPFELHPEGDGSLRALGLDAHTWRKWVAALLAQRATLSDYARHLANERDPSERRTTAMAVAEVLRRPGSFCPGSPELRGRLDELWTTYAPDGEAWKRRMTTGPQGIRNRLAPHEQRWLWKGLLPFHDRLSTISVLLVDYSTPVVMPVPPTTCIIAPGSASAEYARQVLAAAEQLATTR